MKERTGLRGAHKKVRKNMNSIEEEYYEVSGAGELPDNLPAQRGGSSQCGGNAERMQMRLIERNHIKFVIFDFEMTDFMDSSGIGVIMGRYKIIRLVGGEVWAVHANARIKKILTMSGMTKIMQIYEEDEA